jgi:hypothetical protein
VVALATPRRRRRAPPGSCSRCHPFLARRWVGISSTGPRVTLSFSARPARYTDCLNRRLAALSALKNALEKDRRTGKTSED